MYRLTLVLCWVIVTMMSGTSAFVTPISLIATGTSSSLSMMDPTIASSLSETVGVAMTSGSGLVLAETEAWVKPVATVLGPFLNFMVRYYTV